MNQENLYHDIQMFLEEAQRQSLVLKNKIFFLGIHNGFCNLLLMLYNSLNHLLVFFPKILRIHFFDSAVLII